MTKKSFLLEVTFNQVFVNLLWVNKCSTEQGLKLLKYFFFDIWRIFPNLPSISSVDELTDGCLAGTFALPARTTATLLCFNILLSFWQGWTNLVFACTDFHAHKMVLRACSCTQNYMYIKQSHWVLICIL